MSTPAITAERAWTEAQLAAIRHVGGDLLVSAAAGSGKTAVLAERCARLVCDGVEGGCGVENLLVLTFTEAAANEMRGRIAEAIRGKLKNAGKLTPDRVKWLQRQGAMVERASISTLHAFCARVLRQHFHEARIDPAFELMDEDEARLLREEVLNDLLARWHGEQIGGHGPLMASQFADFFEAYAQGRDSNCREMILRVYGMLASAADPQAYLRASRRTYSPEGSAETLERYVREVIGGQLRLLTMTARRAAADARRAAGPDAPITLGLEKVTGLLEWSRRELAERGLAELALLRETLANPWPQRLSTMKDIPDFDLLKKRTWEKVKSELKKFCEETLGADVPAMARTLQTLAVPLDVLLAMVADFSHSFEAAKRAQNRLDFSDLERLTLHLLTAEESLAAAELRARYHHVLVDEAQDINPLQDALLRAVRSADRFDGQGNLFVVGDVKQSIYGFRLADPGLFLGWERHARETRAQGREKHVVLAHNFRSQVKLLGTMNGLFERVMTLEVAGVDYRDGHALEAPPARTAPPDPTLRAFDGAPVEMHLLAMDEEDDDADENSPAENLSAVDEEARMVARRIASLLREGRGILTKDGNIRPLACRDIAILLRSMKNRAMTFARALAREGIPVHADLATGYFDAPEVRETLALLQILDNPRQDIPMATVMLGPYGGFLHDDLARVRLAFDQKTVKFAEAVPAFARAAELPADSGQHAALQARLREFLQKLDAWREMLRTTPLHEGLAAIYGESKILAYVAGLEAGEQRVANLQALHQRALKFSGFSKQGLHRFLRFIEKLREQDGDFGEAPVLSEASDVVRIMSVHKSKGLEFPVVVVAGLGGLLNLIEGGPVYVHRELGIGFHVADVERNVFYPSAASACIVEANKRTQRAEELRLLYVAITRARDHLLLTGCVAKKETVQRVRSAWEGHPAALPEDLLLKGRRMLDWILPAIACSGLRVAWNPPGETPSDDAQVVVQLHAPSGIAPATVEQSPQHDQVIDRILHAQPLPAPGAATPDVAGVIARVTGSYSHEAAATRAAVRTVSALKEEALGAADEFALADVATPGRPAKNAEESRRAEDARARGIATHRILELLDFAACDSAAAIDRQIDDLVTRGELLPEDRDRADRQGIRWFLLETDVGRRTVAAATRLAAREPGIHLRREIPFTWAAPVTETERAAPVLDWATIRGTIDLLLVDGTLKTAELVDYKTDSPFTWATRVEEYRRQVEWYLRAAREILGIPVERGTILFLAARQCVEVRATPAGTQTPR